MVHWGVMHWNVGDDESEVKIVSGRLVDFTQSDKFDST